MIIIQQLTTHLIIIIIIINILSSINKELILLHLFHGSGLTGLKLHIIISSFRYKQRHYPLILVSHPLRISTYFSQI